MASAVSNLNSLASPFPPSSKRDLSSAAACAKNNPFLRFSPCPLTRPAVVGGCRFTTRAMVGGGGDGKERSHEQQLQRAVKQSQSPRRRISQVAPLGLWDRFPTARNVEQMIETMERIMDDPFAYSGTSSPSLDGDDGGVGYRRGKRTPWEIKDGESEYKMRFDMPGMTRKDVKVWVEEKVLVVAAEKVPDNKSEEGEWSAKSYGRYNSRIALPENVVVEKIRAEVKDGVLYITIPKASTSGKVVDINVQ